MTQERLRELLQERVVDEGMPDYSATAWRAARRVRRRRRLGAAAGVVAATVGVSAAIAAVDSTPLDPKPHPVEPAVDVSEPPDATYRGGPVWWSPDQFEEHELAPIGSPLPAEIQLDASEPFVPDELDHALAAFARGRSVVLVGPDGQLRTVDVTRLQKVTKPNGYSYFPTGTGMLTSNGEWLVFRQPGPTYAIFRIRTGEWSTVDSFSDAADSAPDGLPFDASASQPYGENRDGAQSYGMGVTLPVRDPSTYLSNPEFLVADGAVLAFMDRFSGGQSSRYKDCCPVAGWLDPDTVVYESRQTGQVLVAWRLRTHDFFLVSRIRGEYDVASFAF
jgi:hypothetical protein